MTTMSPRERILRAMRRQEPDRVPREARFTLPVEEEFRLRTGASDYVTYYGMDRRFIQFRRPYPPLTSQNMWGRRPMGPSSPSGAI